MEGCLSTCGGTAADADVVEAWLEEMSENGRGCISSNGSLCFVIGFSEAHPIAPLMRMKTRVSGQSYSTTGEHISGKINGDGRKKMQT